MENLCSIYRFLVCIVFYHQFQTFRGLLTGQASLGFLEWNLWQMERPLPNGNSQYKFSKSFVNGKRPLIGKSRSLQDRFFSQSNLFCVLYLIPVIRHITHSRPQSLVSLLAGGTERITVRAKTRANVTLVKSNPRLTEMSKSYFLGIFSMFYSPNC